jgi:hypothetical protein
VHLDGVTGAELGDFLFLLTVADQSGNVHDSNPYKSRPTRSAETKSRPKCRLLHQCGNIKTIPREKMTQQSRSVAFGEAPCVPA